MTQTNTHTHTHLRSSAKAYAGPERAGLSRSGHHVVGANASNTNLLAAVGGGELQLQRVDLRPTHLHLALQPLPRDVPCLLPRCAAKV
eukprot:1258437-Rhodomonas_salina.1